MIKIRYAQIRELDISNGEGVGVSLFVQGCPFHCYNCFNPETWDFNGGKEWTKEIKEEFLMLIDRPYIKRISILGGDPLAGPNLDDVLNLVTEIRKKYPLTTLDMALDNKQNYNILLQEPNRICLSRQQKTIWIYSGYTWEEIFNQSIKTQEKLEFKRRKQQIIKYCNVFVDGKYVDSKRDMALKWMGSSNQRVIDIQKSLIKEEIVLWTN